MTVTPSASTEIRGLNANNHVTTDDITAATHDAITSPGVDAFWPKMVTAMITVAMARQTAGPAWHSRGTIALRCCASRSSARSARSIPARRAYRLAVESYFNDGRSPSVATVAVHRPGQYVGRAAIYTVELDGTVLRPSLTNASTLWSDMTPGTHTVRIYSRRDKFIEFGVTAAPGDRQSFTVKTTLLRTGTSRGLRVLDDQTGEPITTTPGTSPTPLARVRPRHGQRNVS